LLAHGQWFSPGTPASSTTKTCRHDIAESGVKHNKSNQIKTIFQILHNDVIDNINKFNLATVFASIKCFYKK
jgi:hypothetical protein